MRYEIKSPLGSFDAIYPSAFAAWSDAFDRFGGDGICTISVRPLPA